MRDAYVALVAVSWLIIGLMFGCLGTAKGAEMRECLEGFPYAVTHNDPLWGVWSGSEVLKIDDEDDADVDHCYDPHWSDEYAIYPTRERAKTQRREGGVL